MATKRKVTLTLPEEVVRAYRLAAARKGVPDNAVVEAALRNYLGIGALAELQGNLSALSVSGQDAEGLAVQEVKAVRRRRKTA
jgi:hypothetical protein